MRIALLRICCLSAVAAHSSVGAAGPDEPSEGVHLRSGYFAAHRQQKTSRDVLVTHTRTRQSADGNVVEVLSTEKLVPIVDDDVDDLVELIAAERKLQDTQAEGIREVYKKPNKNYNNKKKSSSSSSRKKGSSSSKSKSKKKSKESKKKSRSSTKTDDKKKRKSRSKRKRKKSLFKKKSKNSTSKSGSKCKVDKDCRDDCIIENKCDWAKDKMCDKQCKQDCCLLVETSGDNETGDSDDGMDEPTAAPVANGGGGPAPEPTTLQPVAPVAITPAPTVALPEPRSCPSDVTSFTFSGSLGCSPGGCCIVLSDSASMQDLCNFPALSTVGVASIENGQIFVDDIDTTGESGPFEIQEGCEISCTSQCRVSPIVPQVPEAPADLTTYSGPGTISCTDGYCETDNASGCNIVGFNAVGNVGVNDSSKTVAYNIESAAAPVVIESGCIIDCSESTCTFGRAAF